MLLAESLDELGNSYNQNVLLEEMFPFVYCNEEYISECTYLGKDIIISEAQKDKAEEEINDWMARAKDILAEDKEKFTDKYERRKLITFINLGINLAAFVVGTITGAFVVTLPIQLISLIIQLVVLSKTIKASNDEMAKIRSMKRKVNSMKEKARRNKKYELVDKLDELIDELDDYKMTVANSR